MFTKKQKRINWILVAVLLVLSIFFLFPVIWMLANSFKPDAAITADMNSIAAFIPPAPGGNFFDNYVSIITDTNFLRYMGNTLLYAAILIVLSIVVNGLAGYAPRQDQVPVPRPVAYDHHHAAHRTDRDGHHDPFPYHRESRAFEYDRRLHPAADRKSVQYLPVPPGVRQPAGRCVRGSAA